MVVSVAVTLWFLTLYGDTGDWRCLLIAGMEASLAMRIVIRRLTTWIDGCFEAHYRQQFTKTEKTDEAFIDRSV